MNKKLLAIAISSALAAPMAAQAVSFAVGGHVNRAIMFADDGNDSDVMQVDNAASQTRVNISGSESLGVGGLTVGFNLEWGYSSNASNNVTINGQNGAATVTDDAFNIRHSALWFEGGWGRLTMGHTSAANDGAHSAGEFTDLGLANLTVAATSFGGAINFQNGGVQATRANGTSTVSVGQSTATFDGGRYDVVRYDTPVFGPVRGAVSVGDNGVWAVGARLNSSFSGARIAAAVGYDDQEQAAGFEQWAISGGVQFSQGTALGLSYSERDIHTANPANKTAGNCGVAQAPAGATQATTNNSPCFGGEARTADNFYALLSHTWGNNSIGVNYNETSDRQANGEDATSWGVGFVHNLPGPRVQLYTGYTNYDLDSPAVANGGVGSTEDIDVFNIGARVRF